VTGVALLAGRKRVIGTVLTLPGATVAELLAEPFDFVWIDMEHAALGPLDAQEMIIGAQAAGTLALPRVPAEAHLLMTQLLDAGADGIVVADVKDPDQAKSVVRALQHPPNGPRGWGPRRSALRSRGRREQPDAPSVWMQVETANAVEQAAEIAAVSGVDALIIGTADLSFSLGAPLDLRSVPLSQAVASVEAAARAAGVAFGLAGALDQLPGAVLEAASILVHSTDARLCAAAVDGVARLFAPDV
jgi:4-hydroxy-2-oxoheptanedioate aldolase